jgi:multicomponent K+:H+ antiporter subunit D
MLKAALASDQAGWVWPPVLISSLAALIMLSRSGGTLFWRARGESASTVKSHPVQLVAVFLLVLALPLMVIFAGSITEFALATAQEMKAGISFGDQLPTAVPGGDDA